MRPTRGDRSAASYLARYKLLLLLHSSHYPACFGPKTARPKQRRMLAHHLAFALHTHTLDKRPRPRSAVREHHQQAALLLPRISSKSIARLSKRPLSTVWTDKGRRGNSARLGWHRLRKRLVTRPAELTSAPMNLLQWCVAGRDGWLALHCRLPPPVYPLAPPLTSLTFAECCSQNGA